MPSSRRILYVQFTNPATYPPLEHSARLLARKGWEVRFIGTRSQEGRDLALSPLEQISVSRLPLPEPGWRQKLVYLRFAVVVLKTVIMWRPEVIYVSDALATPASLLARLASRPRFIYHEHDFPLPATGFFAGLVSRARKRVAGRSDVVITPNEERRELLISETSPRGQALTVMNCPALDEIQDRRRDKSRGLKLIYIGSVVPNRLPVTVLEAMAKTGGDLSLTIAGYETIGHPGYVNTLRNRARDLGLAERVRYAGPIPTHKDLLELVARADVGLSLIDRAHEDVNLQTMAGASNKPFDYLTSGLALLVSNDPEWESMFVEPGYALSCNPADPSSIADALRVLQKERGRRIEMGEAGRQRLLNEWNYEEQFEPVLRLLEPNS